MDVVDRIFQLADLKYSEQREFAEALKIPASRVSEWRRRKSESYMKRIPQIAAVLDTTSEYLLTGEKDEAVEPEPASKSAMMAAFWGGDKDLTQEDMDAMWADVENFAAFIAQKKKQEKGKQ